MAIRYGYLLLEGGGYLLLEGGGRLIINQAEVADKIGNIFSPGISGMISGGGPGEIASPGVSGAISGAGPGGDVESPADEGTISS